MVTRLPIKPNPEATQRLMAKVDDPDENGCMNWTGAKTPRGYGRFGLKIGTEHRTVYPHRYLWTLEHGPIPDDREVDHLCRNTSCVNTDHLEVVTHFENSVVRAKGRGDPGTHCKRGHERTPENTYYHKDAKRKECRLCALERMKAQYVKP